jgi:predicted ATPase
VDADAQRGCIVVRAPEGYRLVKPLRNTARSRVAVATRASDGREVILKTYVGDSAHVRARLERERDCLAAVAGAGVPQVVDLLEDDEGPMLVLERAPGITLLQWTRAKLPEVDAILGVALQLAASLARVHAARLVHRDVNPSNVLVDPATLRAHLIDFGLTRPLGSQARHEDASQESMQQPIGQHYISPERTGRMNRGIDARSDLYSLGATLYYVATGAPPFEGSHRLALYHAHLAQLPRSPLEHRPGLPASLAAIVLKLLAKQPEARYQTASGLEADLRRCRDALALGQGEASFELGTDEAPSRPRMAAGLVGRDAEVAALRQAYADAASRRAVAFEVLGDAGMGKSALLEGLRPALAETRGYVAVGKFDAYAERAYAGWMRALGTLSEQLLAESAARFGDLRDALRTALGPLAGALAELVPDLELILGERLEPPALDPLATQARLALALQRFICACARPEHPLVLFLDDVQWADPASRFLIEQVLRGTQGCALLLVAASRLEGAEPLVSAALAQRIDLRTLRLGPLSEDATVELLAGALARRVDDVRPLAALVGRKTGHTPLLIRQLVEHLHERGWIRHATGVGWTWDPAEVAAADIPDGAGVYLAAKLERLAPDTGAVLELASCVADDFDLQMLRELCGREEQSIGAALYELCDEGLIVPCSAGFRFAHDRVREAARARLSDAERARLHCEMGRYLLSRTPEADWPRRAAEIAEHLNQGLAAQSPADVEPQLRDAALRLNRLAGARALASGAADAGSSFFAAALRLFGDADWEASRDLGFELHLQSATSLSLAREPAEALALLDRLDARVASGMERARVAVARLQIYALERSAEFCVEYALGVLRQLGVRFRPRPSRLRAVLALTSVHWLLVRRPVEALLVPARSADLQRLPILLVLGAAASAFSRVDLRLAATTLSFVMRLNARQGYRARPGFSLAGYATYRLALLRRGDRHARRYADAARRLCDPVRDPVWAARTEFMIHCGIEPWLQRRRAALAAMPAVIGRIQEAGDPQYAYYAWLMTLVYGALAGEPIAATERGLAQLAATVDDDRHPLPGPAGAHAAYRLLCAEREEDLDFARASAEATRGQVGSSAEPLTRTLLMLALCVYRRFDLALQQSELLGERLFRIIPYVHVADHLLYRGLAAAALASEGSGRTQRVQLRTLRACARLLRRRAAAGPDFVHMVFLLDAERARLRGQGSAARRLYERAAARAREQGFVHHEALAHERLAECLRAQNRWSDAQQALLAAARRYADWGAVTKARSLDAEREPS